MGIVSLSSCARYTWPVKRMSSLERTHVFVGQRFVVSVRHGSLQSHVGLRARCEASQHLLAEGPASFVLYALMDFVVDQYFPILEALEERVVELEERLDHRLEKPAVNRALRTKTRRKVLPFRSVIDTSKNARNHLSLIGGWSRPPFALRSASGMWPESQSNSSSLSVSIQIA